MLAAANCGLSPQPPVRRLCLGLHQLSGVYMQWVQVTGYACILGRVH